MDGLTKHFRDAPPMAKAKKFDQLGGEAAGICILWGIQWNCTRASLDWHAHRPVIGTHLHLLFYRNFQK